MGDPTDARILAYLDSVHGARQYSATTLGDLCGLINTICNEAVRHEQKKGARAFAHLRTFYLGLLEEGDEGSCASCGLDAKDFEEIADMYGLALDEQSTEGSGK